MRSLVQRGANGVLSACSFFGQLVAEPAHRPVEVVELEVVASVDLVVLPPLVGGAVAAGGEEPVQDGEEDGPLEGELEAASLEELLGRRAGSRWPPRAAGRPGPGRCGGRRWWGAGPGRARRSAGPTGPGGRRRRAGRRAGRSAGVDRAARGWRRRAGGSGRPPSGSRRPGGRCVGRRSWCGRTWCPPMRDTMRIATKSRKSRGISGSAWHQDFTSPSESRPIAKGLTSNIEENTVKNQFYTSIPQALIDLARGRDFEAHADSAHKAWKATLERHGHENICYALLVRGHQINGRSSDITFVRYPHREPEHFQELLDLLVAAAGRPPVGNPTVDYSRTTLQIAPTGSSRQEILERIKAGTFR